MRRGQHEHVAGGHPRQQLAKCAHGLREVLLVIRRRHRQRHDQLAAALQRHVGHQPVGALGERRDHPQGCRRILGAQVREQRRDARAIDRVVSRLQVAVADDADHERQGPRRAAGAV